MSQRRESDPVTMLGYVLLYLIAFLLLCIGVVIGWVIAT